MRCLVYTVAQDYPPALLTVPLWRRYARLHGHDMALLEVKPTVGVTAHWHRYAVFEAFPDYDRYLYVDADVVPHWDAPDLFERFLDEDAIHVVPDQGGLVWIRNAVETFQPLFPDIALEWEQYFNSGVLLFSAGHRQTFRDFRRFRSRRWAEFQQLVADQLRDGHTTDAGDQTLFNYFLAAGSVPVRRMPQRFNLQHLHVRGGMERNTYVDYGTFWHFCGLGPARVEAVIQGLLREHGARYA